MAIGKLKKKKRMICLLTPAGSRDQDGIPGFANGLDDGVEPIAGAGHGRNVCRLDLERGAEIAIEEAREGDEEGGVAA